MKDSHGKMQTHLSNSRTYFLRTRPKVSRKTYVRLRQVPVFLDLITYKCKYSSTLKEHNQKLIEIVPSMYLIHQRLFELLVNIFANVMSRLVTLTLKEHGCSFNRCH